MSQPKDWGVLLSAISLGDRELSGFLARNEFHTFK